MEILKILIEAGLQAHISIGTNCKVTIIVSPLLNYDVLDRETIFMGDNLEQVLIKILDYITYTEI